MYEDNSHFCISDMLHFGTSGIVFLSAEFDNTNKAVWKHMIVVKKILNHVKVYMYISPNLCYNFTIKSSDRKNSIQNNKGGVLTMKIQEFRDKLKQCKREDVEKIASELYKMLPKNKKEEDADTMIADIIAGKTADKKQTTNAIPDFDSLKKDINEFLNNADNDLYIKPNRVVPKNKRSKWRFEVKNFVKMLNMIPADGENGEDAAILLRELYKRLAQGCGYYVFPTEDPFQSIGIRQPDFYEMLVKRTFATGFTDEKIRNMLEDAALVFIDRNSLHSELETIYAASLTTSDLKYKALGVIKEYVEQYETEFAIENKSRSNKSYQIRCYIEELCETMLVISILLYEPGDAVEYYWQHDKESDKEITLYKILDTVREFGDEKLWMKVYEDGLNKNIKPRNSLQKLYQELKSS